jgi:hypothetical protein
MQQVASPGLDGGGLGCVDVEAEDAKSGDATSMSSSSAISSRLSSSSRLTDMRPALRKSARDPRPVAAAGKVR